MSNCTADLAGFANCSRLLTLFNRRLQHRVAATTCALWKNCYHLRLERKAISDEWENLAHSQTLLLPSPIWYSIITILRLQFVYNSKHKQRNEAHIAQSRRRRHPGSGAAHWWEAGNTCWLLCHNIKSTRSSSLGALIIRSSNVNAARIGVCPSVPRSFLRPSVCLSTCLQSIRWRRELPGLRRLKINHQYNGDCVAAEWCWLCDGAAPAYSSSSISIWISIPWPRGHTHANQSYHR